jgi:hypothetical protein
VGEFELKGIRRPLAAYNVVTRVNGWPRESRSEGRFCKRRYSMAKRLKSRPRRSPSSGRIVVEGVAAIK